MVTQEDEDEEPFASIKDPAERQAFVKELHLLKTDIFMRMVESGMMPLRPGVKRLVGERTAVLCPAPACSGILHPHVTHQMPDAWQLRTAWCRLCRDHEKGRDPPTALTCPAGEAMEAGTPIAVCSTSNERAVSTIVKQLLGPEVAAKMRVFAGDVVPKKKPAPDIYNLAAKELGVNPRMCACRPAHIDRH